MKRGARATAPIAAIASLALLLGAAACNNVGANDPIAGHANEGTPRVSFDTPETKELLGKDDGFHGAIFYGGEMQGSIDDCGCPSHPEGGMPWRMGYTEGFRSAYPEVGYLQVDAGTSMSTIVDAKGQLFPDSVVKSDWVLKAFDKFNFDAANISYDDIYYLSRYLKKGEWEKAVAEHPMLARFVSANIEPTKPDQVAPPPYIVRAITGSRIPGGNLRVAFIGLTDENVRTSMNTGFQIVAPEKGLAKVIDKARSESDMVVVLAFMNPDMLKAMAPKFEGKVDAYIVAHSRAHTMAPELDGPARYLYSRYQTKQLGVLRLYLDDKKLDRVTNDYVVLDAKLPKDPEAQQMAADSKDAIKKAQEERFNAAMINNGGTGQPEDAQPAQPAQPGQSPAQPVQPAKPAGN
jgi:hypothetical protein